MLIRNVGCRTKNDTCDFKEAYFYCKIVSYKLYNVRNKKLYMTRRNRHN